MFFCSWMRGECWVQGSSWHNWLCWSWWKALGGTLEVWHGSVQGQSPRDLGHTREHPVSKCRVAQCCSPCTPTCPAVAPCPAHRQVRLVAQRWAHCSAVPCSGSGGGRSTGTASSSVARRRWKSLRGERWPGECSRSSAQFLLWAQALWSAPCGASDPCPMEEGNSVLWSMGCM